MLGFMQFVITDQDTKQTDKISSGFATFKGGDQMTIANLLEARTYNNVKIVSIRTMGPTQDLVVELEAITEVVSGSGEGPKLVSIFILSSSANA